MIAKNERQVKIAKSNSNFARIEKPSLKITRIAQMLGSFGKIIYLLTGNRGYIYDKIQHKETFTKTSRYKYQGTILKCK